MLAGYPEIATQGGKRGGRWHWIGVYQPLKLEPAGGWRRFAGCAETNFSRWASAALDNNGGNGGVHASDSGLIPAGMNDCAAMGPSPLENAHVSSLGAQDGDWYDFNCGQSLIANGYGDIGCLCQWPGHAARDATWENAWHEGERSRQRHNAALFFGAVGVITLLPVLYSLAGVCIRSRRSASDGFRGRIVTASGSPGAPSVRKRKQTAAAERAARASQRLDGAQRGARRLHWTVSFATASVGWLLFVVCTMQTVYLARSMEEQLPGPKLTHFMLLSLFGPGLCLMLLSVLSTDANRIHAICVVCMLTMLIVSGPSTNPPPCLARFFPVFQYLLERA